MYKITNVYNFIEALSHVKRGAEYVKLDIYDTQWILGNFYVGCQLGERKQEILTF